MRSFSMTAGALLLLLATGCGGSSGGITPTEEDIVNSLEQQLRSVTGGWTGFAPPPGTLTLDFQLQEGSNGAITGTGTMKENSTAAAVPITITGTFQRPVLSMTINGMVVDAKAVTATASGNYVTVAGLTVSLNLTAPGYTRQIPVLIQEKL